MARRDRARAGAGPVPGGRFLLGVPALPVRDPRRSGVEPKRIYLPSRCHVGGHAYDDTGLVLDL